MNSVDIKFLIVNLKNKRLSGAQLREEELAILQLNHDVEILLARLEAREQIKTIRKVVQISYYNNELIALCDDGTIWNHFGYAETSKWLKFVEIPQD